MALPLTLVVFFVSGGLALGYQVLWSKYLLDVIGVSSYSYATVLAAFMGGLGLGSWLFGRWVDRWRSPLRGYAYLEAGVGIYAVAYPLLTRWAASAYGRWVVYTPGHEGGAAALWAKVLVAGALLVPPAMLMGGTFPALLRHVTTRLTLVGRRASQLYGINSLGAVVGSLLMAFVLMPMLGMSASLTALALGNGAIALVAFGLSFSRSRGAFAPSAAAGEPPAPRGPAGALSRWQVRAALAVVCAEGVVSFLYEIAWTRYFGIVLGSSTYSFALMLASFITGIAIGSAILAAADGKVSDPLATFGWTQVIAAALVVAPLPVYQYLPWLLTHVQALFSTTAGAFYLNEVTQLSLCFAAMVPPTILVGMSIPLVVKGLARREARVGADSGSVYAWNTWGNLGGALAGGLVLLPVLGTEGLVRGAAMAGGALGIVQLLVFAGRRRAIAAAAGALITALALIPAHWDQRWFTFSAFRRSDGPVSYAGALQALAQRTTLFVKDDPAAHVMVTGYREGPLRYLALSVGGKVDATSFRDMPTQLLLGHVPLVLADATSSVLVVGLASGVTAGAVLAHDVRRVDVVEIVRAMPQAARLFTDPGGSPLDDARLHVIIDDARSYMSYTDQTYDVIISEPSNPWMAGVGSLFSRDFYRKALRVLSPDGIYLQWVQGYEIGNDTLAAVLRSFRASFPFVYGFQGSTTDLLLLGSRRPLTLRPDQLRARCSRPEVARQLAALGMTSPESLLALQRFSPATLDIMASATDRENTDDNHLLEYRAPQDLFRESSAVVLDDLDERLVASPALLWARLPAESRQLIAAASGGILADPRIRPPAVCAGLVGAESFLRRGFAAVAAPGEASLEPSAAQLAAYLDAAVRSGRIGETVRTITSYRPAILWSAALSPEAASFWNGRAADWVAAAGNAGGGDAFRGLAIDLLIAGHREDLAAGELRAWAAGPHPPATEWALLRGCRIDPGALCDELLANALRRGGSPLAVNLASLRAGSR